jgi:hypothetical protein
MIVKDKVISLVKANEISVKIMKIISEETKNFHPDDDPAEQIYLACHILGNLKSKILISLEGYGKIYGISNMTIKSINEWISNISNEYLKSYEKE